MLRRIRKFVDGLRKDGMNLVLILFISVVLIGNSGCAREIAGLSVKKGVDGSFDEAAYDYLYAEGIKQKLTGNSGEAIKLFEQCINMKPESDAPYYQISQILMSNGDLNNGKKYALKASYADEKNIWYLSLLAGIYYQQKNLDSATVYYEKIVKFYPEKEEIYITLGNIYSEKGDYKKASDTFSFLERKYGVNENITMSQVKNLINAGDYTMAEEKIRELIGRFPDEILYNGILAEIYRSQGKIEKALGVYEKLVNMDPSDPQTLVSFSDFMLQTGNYDGLFSILNTVLLSEKISKEEKISLLANSIENDTLVKERGNDLELGIRVLEATYKDDGIVCLLRPEYYMKAGKEKEAISRLEEIIQIFPDNYFAWEKLLIAYADNREFDKLYIKGEECATKFNRSYIAKILYASAASEKEKYDIALEEIRKAKILAGNNPQLIIQALTIEADIYYRKNDSDRCFSTFREALKLDPEDLTVLNNYSYYLAEKDRDLDKAEEMINIVIKKEPGNVTFLDTYAWVLFKRGKLKQAASVMEAIISKGDEDADWFEHYGFILKGLKKCESAAEHWKRSMDLDKNRTYLIKEIENCTKK